MFKIDSQYVYALAKKEGREYIIYFFYLSYSKFALDNDCKCTDWDE